VSSPTKRFPFLQRQHAAALYHHPTQPYAIIDDDDHLCRRRSEHIGVYLLADNSQHTRSVNFFYCADKLEQRVCLKATPYQLRLPCILFFPHGKSIINIIAAIRRLYTLRRPHSLVSQTLCDHGGRDPARARRLEQGPSRQCLTSHSSEETCPRD
jgi:hypothetical protein